MDRKKAKNQLVHELEALQKNSPDSDRWLNDVPAVYKQAPIGLCVFDRGLRYKHINDWLAKLNGASVEDHLGHTIFEVLSGGAQIVERQIIQVFLTGEPIIGSAVEAESVAYPGIKMAFKHHYYPIKSDSTTVEGVSCVVEDVSEQFRVERDLQNVFREFEDRVIARTIQLDDINSRLREEITERRKTERLLKTNEQKYRAVFESAYDGVIMSKANGVLELVNEKILHMSGYLREELIGKPIGLLIPDIAVDGLQDWKNYFRQAATRGRGAGLELSLNCRNGNKLPIDISLSSKKIAGETIVTAVIHDISVRKKTQALLVHYTSHDALTGFINRQEFESRAKRLLTSCKRDKDKHVLCFMDMDQFKLVNDTCSRAAGDEMLRQISLLLADRVRNRDTLARLGGNEFGILMEHCSLQHAYRVARTLQKALQNYHFTWGRHQFKIGMSVGMVSITSDTDTIAEALKHADEACYLSKEQGGNRINIYQPDGAGMRRRQAETQMVESVYNAFEENGFLLYAQPISPLDGRADNNFEILLRMKDKKGQIVTPDEFLPAAEKYNLAVKIDQWVIENVFEFLVKNTVFQVRDNFCSVNLTGQSLTDSSILKLITEKLSETGIRGNKLCFEISGVAALSNLNAAMKFISSLRKLGCRFALDDFGSDLSSFAHLKELPVDFVKIDRVFVRNIGTDPIDYSILKSIHEVCHLMGVQTIAQGVEDSKILHKLATIGVDYSQGFIVGKPGPIKTTAWIEKKNATLRIVEDVVRETT